MRIAIITTSYAQSNNDWSVPPLIEFVRSIAADIEVDVYTLYYPLEQRRYRVFGTRIFSYNLGQKPRLLRGLHKARIRNDFTQEHAARPYDLIHAVWADTPAALAAQLSARLNIPLITTVYAGEAVRNRLWRFAQPPRTGGTRQGAYAVSRHNLWFARAG